MPFFGGLIIGGLGLIGSLNAADASNSAAQTQANASLQAQQIQQQEFNSIQALEQPYVNAGNNALGLLDYGLGTGSLPGTGNAGTGITSGSLIAPFNPANLSQTPGYQFELQQGEQAVLDKASATGGVGGGNTLKALTDYGQGLASTTYQQQLQDYMAQQQAQLGALQTSVGSGQAAAGGLASAGQTNASNIGNLITGGAAATAAGQVGSANAITGGINNLSGNYLLSQLTNNGSNPFSFSSLFGGGATPFANLGE